MTQSVFRLSGGPGLPNHVIIPNASHVEDMWGLQPQATTRLVAGFLAAENVAAHFDATIDNSRPAFRGGCAAIVEELNNMRARPREPMRLIDRARAGGGGVTCRR